MPLTCRPNRRFAYLLVLALALTMLASSALAQQIPGRNITIPPGSSEGVGGFWAHWLSVDNSSIANGSEFYAFFSDKFDAGTSWPVNNFEPTFNLHVTSSNPAYHGLAVSPVQVDFNGGTVQLYTHGGGTYNQRCNCYDSVQVHTAGPTLTIHPGVLYDFSLHVVVSTSSTTGYADLWAYAHDGTMTAPVEVDSVHSATMYNSDPGPLSLYYGFYTRGAPGASPQPNNDQATFNENVWLPRIGSTVASAFAHTPTVVAEWGSLDRDTTIMVNGAAPAASPATLDGANFVCPILWNCTPSAPAASSPPAVSQSTSQAAPSGPDLPLAANLSPATDSGCNACVASISRGPGDVDATIAGGLDSLDTAYGLADFGGSAGWSGRVWTRDVIALAPSTTLGGNLSVLQQRDASDKLVWEIYVDGSNRQISLWSPAGGLSSSALNQSTGVAMDGQSHRIEVSALPNNSVIVRVDDQDRITLDGLSGATSGSLRFLRAGIDHYDTGTSNEPLSIRHSDVGASTLGWLGTRVSALASTSASPSAAGGTSQSSGGAAPSQANNSASGTTGSQGASGTPSGGKAAPSGGKAAPSGAAAGKARRPSVRRPVIFVERPRVAARRTVLVRLATRPRFRLQIIVRDARGRALGSTYAVSTRKGRSLQLVTLHSWQGQTKLNVIVKSHVAGHPHRTNMRIDLSNRELATCRGAH